MMKRPSNVILGFILAVGATFLTWMGWLILANVIQFPSVDTEESFKFRIEEGTNVSVNSSHQKCRMSDEIINYLFKSH